MKRVDLKLNLANLAATEWLAEQLAQALVPGVRIFLAGDLGVGKTQFTRSLLRGLGHTGRVRSPTFALLESYKLSRFELHHFDFYRFSGENEWREIGFDELLSDPACVCVVEWPQMAGSKLPQPELRLLLASDDDVAHDCSDEAGTKRFLEINAFGLWASAWLTQLTNTIAQNRGEGVSLRPE